MDTTVSLYTCKHDIYKDIAEDVESRFDTSSYELDIPFSPPPPKKNWS